jgi:hypothetical protein
MFSKIGKNLMTARICSAETALMAQSRHADPDRAWGEFLIVQQMQLVTANFLGA